MSPYLSFHLLLMAAASATALSNCYLPNGTALPFSAAYEPCIATESVISMCCVLNVTALVNLGLSATRLDTCLPNGMCQPPAEVGGFARDLCTDPTWKSPNCLNICVRGSDGGTAEDASALTQCTDGSWCCGSQNTACCNNNQGFQVAKSIPPYAAADASSTGTGAVSSPTGTGTTSPTQKPQTSTPTNPPHQRSSNGAEIGLGAALGVILVAIIAVAVYLFFKKRGLRRGRVELGGDSKIAYPMIPVQQGVVNQYGQGQFEGYQPLQPQVQIHEIAPRALGFGPAGVSAAEMDGAGGRHPGMS
ncbi:hypothetical protein N431DRAFT_549678 [Stipitochalara longipes BDJ]|nr:hypothetical protein N431DRAFT_549678 [Stipitochalara longipes BDJ]